MEKTELDVIKRMLRFWTTENRDTIIIENALVAYEWTGEHSIDIGPVFVHPAHRRKGLGVKVLQMVQQVDSVEVVTATSMKNRPDVTKLMEKAGYEAHNRSAEHIFWIWRKNE